MPVERISRWNSLDSPATIVLPLHGESETVSAAQPAKGPAVAAVEITVEIRVELVLDTKQGIVMDIALLSGVSADMTPSSFQYFLEALSLRAA